MRKLCIGNKKKSPLTANFRYFYAPIKQSIDRTQKGEPSKKGYLIEDSLDGDIHGRKEREAMPPPSSFSQPLRGQWLQA